jgi:signal transduction histidine kinase
MRRDPWDLLKKAHEKLLEVEACSGDAAESVREVRLLIDALLASDEPTTAEVLRILGHELKAPVSAMVALLASVSDGYLSAEPVRAQEMVEKARRRAEEMLPLIDDIVELGSLAAGSEELPRDPVEMTALCAGVVHLWEPLFAQRGMRIEGRIPPGRILVSGSQTFLRRVVTNLVMNAFKYNRPGGRVTLALSIETGDAVIRVSDTGVGIPPEDLPHVFSFLYRGRQARRNPDGGLGLGLSLVRQIVESHGGTIEASSVVDTGTTMTIRLPLAG